MSEFSLILNTFRCTLKPKNTGAGTDKMSGIVICMEAGNLNFKIISMELTKWFMPKNEKD